MNLLAAILKRIGSFNVNSFTGRLIFQKTVYFLQRFGINFEYNYNWYIYGPYSQKLHKDSYEIVTLMKNSPKADFLNEDMDNRINNLVNFLDDKKTNSNWLELLASIDFLKKLAPDMTKSEIINQVMSKQTHFELSDFESAWKYLEENNL
jgi:uncharacterized protein YwgA